MLVRKLPDELFAERRTFAHDLFGAEEVQGYLDNLDWAIGTAIDELGDAGSFDVFEFSRQLGHRLGLACWIGREAPIAALVPEFEILDGAEAFVHPERSRGATKDDELAALRRVEDVIRVLLDRMPIANRASSTTSRGAGTTSPTRRPVSPATSCCCTSRP